MSRDDFGATQLFLSDSRLAAGVLNHLRHQALHRAFGTSREQDNVLTFVLLLGAGDIAYEAARRLSVFRLSVPRSDAAIGAVALRDVALRVAGPAGPPVPGVGSLLALALLGGLAAPGIRWAAHRMHLAEQALRKTEHRVRQERIRRYVAARDRMRASYTSSSPT
jgi:hypothetical protein